MNIGIVTTWMYRGAAVVSKQYEEALKNTDNVYIFARGGEKYPKNDPFWNNKNVHWSKPPIFQFNGTPIKKTEILKWVKLNNIECIIFNEQQFWQPLIWIKEAGIPIIAYIDYYTDSSIKLFDYYDLLLCNTQRHYQSFQHTNKAIYIPWGTNIREYHKNIKKPLSKIKLLFNLGHNWHRKGLDQFLNAIDDDLTILKHFELIIYTQKPISFSDIRLKNIYETIKNQYSLKENLGDFLPEEIYPNGDIYIYLSRLDGIGLSLPEALSFGLPAIVPDNPPMNEFVSAGKNGWYVDVERYYKREDNYYHKCCEIDKNSLIETLNLIINQKGNIEKIKIETRNIAKQKIDWKKNSSNLSSILRRLKPHIKTTVSEKDLMLFDKETLNKLSLKTKLSLLLRNIEKYLS